MTDINLKQFTLVWFPVEEENYLHTLTMLSLWLIQCNSTDMPDKNSYWLKHCIISDHNTHYSVVQLSTLSLILCFLPPVVCTCINASFPLVSVYISQVYICIMHLGCWSVIKVYETNNMLSVAICWLLWGMFPLSFLCI